MHVKSSKVGEDGNVSQRIAEGAHRMRIVSQVRKHKHKMMSVLRCVAIMQPLILSCLVRVVSRVHKHNCANWTAMVRCVITIQNVYFWVHFSGKQREVYDLAVCLKIEAEKGWNVLSMLLSCGFCGFLCIDGITQRNCFYFGFSSRSRDET